MKPPFVMESEDGTVWIEFIKQDKRFVITIDPENINDSSWFYVQKEEPVLPLDGNGFLPQNMIHFLKKFYEE